jgi:hypothetical protein
MRLPWGLGPFGEAINGVAALRTCLVQPNLANKLGHLHRNVDAGVKLQPHLASGVAVAKALIRPDQAFWALGYFW